MIEIPLIEYGSRDPFPPVSSALSSPDGLLAFGGDLSSTRLLSAYRSGIFPWFEDGDPILWWSPSVRAVAAIDDIHISRSTLKYARKYGFQITVNQDLRAVMNLCASSSDRADATWITDDMLEAYLALGNDGWVQSVEVWCEDRLVGGLYGVAVHPWFCGESMFSLVPNASKYAVYALKHILKARYYVGVDAQMPTEHLSTLGFKDVDREDFVSRLSDSCWSESPVIFNNDDLNGL